MSDSEQGGLTPEGDDWNPDTGSLLGGIAIGLPFLDAMLRPGRTHAADTTPMRLVVFYSPGGTLLD